MSWQEDLADGLIDAGVEVATWVPDKRLAPIGRRLVERGIALRTLTREDECFGYAAGYRAAGGMPLVLVQSSGLGNSLNAIGARRLSGTHVATSTPASINPSARSSCQLIGHTLSLIHI